MSTVADWPQDGRPRGSHLRPVPRPADHGCQPGSVRCVSEVADRQAPVGDPARAHTHPYVHQQPDQVAADEASAAGDEHRRQEHAVRHDRRLDSVFAAFPLLGGQDFQARRPPAREDSLDNFFGQALRSHLLCQAPNNRRPPAQTPPGRPAVPPPSHTRPLFVHRFLAGQARPRSRNAGPWTDRGSI